MDLNSIDLNLLKFLDALAQERSVTRAGLCLGLSQPAASRALGRLRAMLDDRLVARGQHGLELTPRGQQLTGPVSRLLESARAIVSPPSFNPATASGRYTLAAHDHLALLIVPGLMARFARLAPGLDLDIAQPAGDNVRRVADGAVDLAVGVFDALPASLYRRALYEDRLACVLRAGHPDAAGLDLDGYLALRHIVVTISGVGASPVDAALSARGLTRRVALRVPHFLAAAMMTADSDMALTLPGRLARRLAATLALQVVDLPLPMPPLSPAMIWHERFQDDPAHAWLRGQIVESAQAAAGA